jgi:hypothetical protein
MALSKEFQEFVDEAAGKAHPGESLRLQIHHSVREGFDVIGLALNAGANVDELSNEAVTAAIAIIGKLNIGSIGKRIASAAVPLVVPALVEKMSEFAGDARGFVAVHVMPPLEEVIATLVDVRNDLAGPVSVM